MQFYKSLGGKIILSAVITTVIVAVGTRYVTNTKTHEEVEAYSILVANEAAQRYANDVQRIITDAFTTARTLAASVESARNSGVHDRDAMNAIINGTLQSNGMIIGAWAAFEPNALDGRDAEFANTPNYDATGRFLALLESRRWQHQARNSNRL